MTDTDGFCALALEHAALVIVWDHLAMTKTITFYCGSADEVVRFTDSPFSLGRKYTQIHRLTLYRTEVRTDLLIVLGSHICLGSSKCLF